MSEEKKLNVVLAGNANVGKSVIFNHLTGLHQHIGNWPGKTIEKAEGTLNYRGYTLDILDLPGIYSLATYSLEELISREYIAFEKPDFVINVVDATGLERNLLFTLQLLELERPVVLALNQIDLAKNKGIQIDEVKLEKILGVPVVKTIAPRRYGLTQVLDRGLALVKKRKISQALKYGQEVEERIKKLSQILAPVDLPYPKRWVAIKLLEKDKEIIRLIQEKKPEILTQANQFCHELKELHGHDSSLVIAGERCHLALEIVKKVVKVTEPLQVSWGEKLDFITTHKIWGYPILVFILGGAFWTIFKFGNYFSSFLANLLSPLGPWYEQVFGFSVYASLGWAALESVLALVYIVLPYILPFYLLLYLLENWGYLARVAFLMDNLMHQMGVHGKACIPLMLGFGCNVPACLSCRIMETQRERFITGFLTTLVPCSAVTVIIMGLVGKFVGLAWVFGLYFLALLIIFMIGKISTKILPGESTALIMEMPDYKRPNLKAIFFQTWFRLKEFTWIAAPVIVVSGVIIEAIRLFGALDALANFLSPVTVRWLGLPTLTGILLIFGILRKELILVMLPVLVGTANFGQVLSPSQLITLAIVSMLYIPCVATIAALVKEFGWQKALGVTLLEIGLAIGVGGLAFRLLNLFW